MKQDFCLFVEGQKVEVNQDRFPKKRLPDTKECISLFKKYDLNCDVRSLGIIMEVKEELTVIEKQIILELKKYI